MRGAPIFLGCSVLVRVGVDSRSAGVDLDHPLLLQRLGVLRVGHETVVDADTEVEHVSGLNRFECIGCGVEDVGGEQLRSREFGDILRHARTLAH